MTFQEAKLLSEKYKKEIEYHNKKYYEDDSPEIDDYEYDMMIKKLEELEKSFPQLVSENISPTQKVGGRALEKFSPVNHAVKMESLHDSFSLDEIMDFDKKVKNILGNSSYVVEPKIDGLSVSVEYENGKLVRSSTRGDGVTGEDVTENILTINNLPKILKTNVPFLEVRGEVYMSKENFLLLTKLQEQEGTKTFKNPRNAAAGSLRQKDSNITASRNLDIMIFNIQQIKGKILSGHKESLDFLKDLGFCVPPFYNLYSSISDVLKEIERIGKIKDSLPFQTDGAVVKVDSFENRKILGSTSKFPRWAEAFKYPPEERETELLNIEINVGRTGVLSPIGILKPVFISGSTVGRVALHNIDFIDEKNIKIGDSVLVRKAGEIIPEVVKVTENGNNSKRFEFPAECPSCGEKVIKPENEVAIRCVNTDCPAQLLRNIIHFVSRDAMDIEGLGETLIEKLINKNIINSAVGLYELSASDLLSVERMGEKSSENIIKAIDVSKQRSLDKFIFALGIRHVGQKASKLIAEYFGDIEKIANSQVKDIVCIPGIGQIIAESIYEYFSVEKNMFLIKTFKNHGLCLELKKTDSPAIFTGKTFVLTGSLENYTRGEITELIENSGGKTSSSVSKNTSYVIAGDEPGSKLDKAEKLGIKILSENDFIKMLGKTDSKI